MNCAEIAATLQATLLHQRDARWLREAHVHAELCSGCARLLELHQVEESLAELFPIEPSAVFLESVMNRVKKPQPVASQSVVDSLVGTFKYPTLFVGALILATAYLIPVAGQSWLSNLWPSARLVDLFRLPTYLVQHPPWAIVLAGFAALLILMGLALPEPPVRERV